MMKVTGLKNEFSNPLLLDLITYYENCRFKVTDGYRTYLEAARGFISDAPGEVRDYVLHANKPLSPDMFDMNSISPNKAFPLIIGINNFTKAIQDAESGHTPVYTSLSPVTRKPVPDLKSFEYVGHNDLDIEHRPANYAMLF